MRLLILGGTSFLSRATAEAAVAAGHQVTCACRGLSGPVPEGASHLPWDRQQPAPPQVADGDWDAVVDVSRSPGQVRRAVALLPDAHWVYVSSISVWSDAGPLHQAQHEDVDLAEHPEAYGPMKVACEQIVGQGTASSVVVRPGLIVGPGDPTGRFTYWPERIARGGEVLAPGHPETGVQVIDVRDLAQWLVLLAERRATGVLDAVGNVVPMAELMATVARGVGAEPTLTWVDDAELTERGVQPWAGPRSLPLWLPRPEYDAMMSHDAAPALAAGLHLRPLEETAADTLTWSRATPEATRTGLTPEEERTALRSRP